MTGKFILTAVLTIFLSLGAVHAQVLKIGVGISKPPYVIQARNSGVEYEIVERALQLAGYEMEPHYMPLMRIPHALNGAALDGGMHLRSFMQIDGFFSDSVIFYENYAISIAGKNVTVNNFEDLKKYSVLAFQNAHTLLGEQYAAVVDKHPKYSEISNQELQVRMLLAGRAEVAVADHRIFLHFADVVRQQGNSLSGRFVFHRIFNPTPYQAAFREQAVRDKFNIALRKMHANGEYEHILSKYLGVDDKSHPMVVN